MALIYAVIARGIDTTISEYTEASGNFQQIIRQLFMKIKPNTRITFEAGQE